jgi:SAM-dependent methyltransferase
MFFMEPLLSKTLLPLFGGSYMVWGSCMVFFQALLLAGYAWAHFLLQALGARRYARVHVALLALAALWALLLFSPPPAATSLPLFLEVFRLLAIAAGPPFFALATLSVVLQRCLAESSLPDRDNPYALYAASNLGSLVGLLAYPLAFEPWLDLRHQAFCWWGGYAVLLALNVAAMRFVTARTAVETAPAAAPPPAPLGTRRAAAWLLLSMAGSALLLAVTNAVTFDIASVPLLWVLPLAVYLLTFVLAFKRRPWQPRGLQDVFLWFAIAGLLWFVLSQLRLALPAWGTVALLLGVLFFVCLRCHGALAAARPADPRHLTTFYLALSAGGVAGSIAVNWLAPLLAASLWEFPAALCLAALALALHSPQQPSTGNWRASPRRAVAVTVLLCAGMALSLTVAPALLARGAGAGAAIGFIGAALPLTLLLRGAAQKPWRLAALFAAAALTVNRTETAATGTAPVAQQRNFYGIYRVFDRDGIRFLQHGSTLHGRQYIAGPKRAVPLSYYHPTTPAGAILQSPLMPSFRRLGMIGLGTGALTCYASTGQTFVVYELDPDCIDIAERHFGYLAQARANGCHTQFVAGDGRLSLGRERDGSLDFLALDAFNSGAIPVHLLTLEAFREYFRVLAPDGLLLIHVSNKFLDLCPVVQSSATALGIRAGIKTNMGSVDPDADPTVWMALSRSDAVWRELTAQGWNQVSPTIGLRRPWTDQYSNLLGAMMRY